MNILEQWEISLDELSEAILANGSLRGIVFGYVAELKLRELLERHPDVSALGKGDDHDRKKKGDLRLMYSGSRAACYTSNPRFRHSEGSCAT